MKELKGAIQTGLMILVMTVVAVLAFGMVTQSFVPFRVVESGSMTPTLPVYSVIIVDKRSDYEPGDIITFKADKDKIVTHRLVKTNDDGTFTTKGDANTTPDNWSDPITLDDVQGKSVFVVVFTSPSFWMSPLGGLLAVALLAMGIILWWPEEKKKPELEHKEGDKEHTSAAV